MRRRYLKGKLEDANLYFNCPWCGAINRVDRNKPSDRSNISNEEAFVSIYTFQNSAAKCCLDVIGWIGSVPSSTYATRQPVVGSGCWFCGSTNF